MASSLNLWTSWMHLHCSSAGSAPYSCPCCFAVCALCQMPLCTSMVCVQTLCLLGVSQYSTKKETCYFFASTFVHFNSKPIYNRIRFWSAATTSPFWNRNTSRWSRLAMWGPSENRIPFCGGWCRAARDESQMWQISRNMVAIFPRSFQNWRKMSERWTTKQCYWFQAISVKLRLPRMVTLQGAWKIDNWRGEVSHWFQQKLIK